MSPESFSPVPDASNERLQELTAKKGILENQRAELSAQIRALEAKTKPAYGTVGERRELSSEDNETLIKAINERIRVVAELKETEREISSFAGQA